MKRLLIFLCAALLASSVAAVGCVGGGVRTTVEQYLSAMKEGDYQTAYSLLTKKRRNQLSPDNLKSMGMPPDCTIIDIIEKGLYGAGIVKVGDGTDTLEIAVKIEDGHWKVNDIGIGAPGYWQTSVFQTFQEEGKKVCQENQSLVDGAIKTFHEHYGRYPSSLEEMVKSDTSVLEKAPSCPQGGAYIWVKGDPPHVKCSIKAHNLSQ